MSKQGDILIVDDDAAIRTGLQRILDHHGYTVKTAQTAEEALIALNHQSFDLVISDVHMPGMDGLTLLSEIKQVAPDMAVVIITAYGSTEIVIQALRRGVADFMTKPFQPAEFLSIVEREMAKRRKAAPVGLHEGLGRQFSPDQLDQIDQLMAELRAETNARCVLLVESNGYVIDTKGVIEDINMSALAALVSGDFAATASIASLLGEEQSFRLNYHEGQRYNVYSVQVAADMFLLIIFGPEVKQGMVLYYTRQKLDQFIGIIAPAVPGSPSPTPSPQAAPRLEPAAAQPSPADEGKSAGSPSPPLMVAPTAPEKVFTWEEIQQSGLLGTDLISALDEQLAGLWIDDAP